MLGRVGQVDHALRGRQALLQLDRLLRLVVRAIVADLLFLRALPLRDLRNIIFNL